MTIEKWEIRPAPSADDPDRHILLISGGPADVSALLKKFGALLGRPSPSKAKGFNLSLALHRLKPAARTKLEAWLTKSAPTSTPAQPVLQKLEEKKAEVSALPLPPQEVQASPPAISSPAPYSLATDLETRWTLESLLVGAYNRFAHAAAMSVASSPGSMYNPLFLYGVPGTGKSHMLHAIGAALSKGLGGSVLLLTSGSRLSRAIDLALSRKAMAEIEDRVKNSRALLVDDIHLMAVSDQNKEALSKVFKSFLDRKLQVVVTSLYPPRSLGTLEEALKLSFSKGWSVDLKIPSPAIQKDLIAAAAASNQMGLDKDEVAYLHEKLSRQGYSELGLWLERTSRLKKIRESSGESATLREIFALIYDPLIVEEAKPAKISGVSFTPASAPPGAQPIAVIIPKGQQGLETFVASLFHEIGSKSGFKEVYRHALWETYDPAVPFGLPFMVGEMCCRAGVTRALIVGPTSDSPLGPRSSEFAHATRHILESFGIGMAFVPYAGLQIGANYLNAHLDFARMTSAS